MFDWDKKLEKLREIHRRDAEIELQHKLRMQQIRDRHTLQVLVVLIIAAAVIFAPFLIF